MATEFDLPPKGDPTERPPMFLTVGDQQFRAADLAPMTLLRHFNRLVGGGDIRWSELAPAWRMVLASDDPDEDGRTSADRFFDLVEDPDNQVNLAWLWRTWRDFIPELIARPTSGPQDSAPGASTTGDGSEPSEPPGASTR